MVETKEKMAPGSPKPPAHVMASWVPDLAKEDKEHDGLDVAHCSYALLKDGVLRADSFKAKEVEDKLHINNLRNTVVVSMPGLERAAIYRKIKSFMTGGKTYEVGTYITLPEGCVKGVIHNIPATSLRRTFRSLVNRRNPTVPKTRCQGKSNTAIAFEGGKFVKHMKGPHDGIAV